MFGSTDGALALHDAETIHRLLQARSCVINPLWGKRDGFVFLKAAPHVFEILLLLLGSSIINVQHQASWIRAEPDVHQVFVGQSQYV